MKVLVYGSNGWIGKQFIANTCHEVIVATVRPESYADCYAEIKKVKPDAVAAFIGRTHGGGVTSIDYLEQPGKLYENMRDNYLAPVHLGEACQKLGVQFVYLGTGCIYTYTDSKRLFNENDTPNFFGSGYSTVKGFTDQELRRFDTTLQLRIRMPISHLVSSRNLIDKLVSYKNICSLPNSMTVLDDIWPIVDKMIEQRVVGVFNMCNPGVIEHQKILEMYRELIDSSHTWVNISYEEQMKLIKAERSNNELSCVKLREFCLTNGLELLDITDSVRRALMKRAVSSSL